MGLTMGQRKAVTKANATRYKWAGKADKGKILDELCATTGWHRNHARKALVAALLPRLVPVPRRPRTPVYGPEVLEVLEVLAALRFCWAVLGAPTGKRLAPVMVELVPTYGGSPNSTSAMSSRRCWWGCRPRRWTGGWRRPGPR
jgi:hypothetical protein